MTRSLYWPLALTTICVSPFERTDMRCRNYNSFSIFMSIACANVLDCGSSFLLPEARPSLSVQYSRPKIR
jgi:hypothetical protein